MKKPRLPGNGPGRSRIRETKRHRIVPFFHNPRRVHRIADFAARVPRKGFRFAQASAAARGNRPVSETQPRNFTTFLAQRQHVCGSPGLPEWAPVPPGKGEFRGRLGGGRGRGAYGREGGKELSGRKGEGVEQDFSPGGAEGGAETTTWRGRRFLG